MLLLGVLMVGLSRRTGARPCLGPPMELDRRLGTTESFGRRRRRRRRRRPREPATHQQQIVIITSEADGADGSPHCQQPSEFGHGHSALPRRSRRWPGVADAVVRDRPASGAQDLSAGRWCADRRGRRGVLAEAGAAIAEVGHAERRSFRRVRRMCLRQDRRRAAPRSRPGALPGRTWPGEAARRPWPRNSESPSPPADRRPARSGCRRVRAALGDRSREPAPATTSARLPALASPVADLRLPDSSVIYGGSAGPGLLTRLADTVDGLFLGRFAHDPAALAGPRRILARTGLAATPPPATPEGVPR